MPRRDFYILMGAREGIVLLAERTEGPACEALLSLSGHRLLDNVQISLSQDKQGRCALRSGIRLRYRNKKTVDHLVRVTHYKCPAPPFCPAKSMMVAAARRGENSTKAALGCLRMATSAAWRI